jgi:hypothetical protein
LHLRRNLNTLVQLLDFPIDPRVSSVAPCWLNEHSHPHDGAAQADFVTLGQNMFDQLTTFPCVTLLNFILLVIADSALSVLTSGGPADMQLVTPTLQSQSQPAIICEATRVLHTNGLIG